MLITSKGTNEMPSPNTHVMHCGSGGTAGLEAIY